MSLKITKPAGNQKGFPTLEIHPCLFFTSATNSSDVNPTLNSDPSQSIQPEPSLLKPVISYIVFIRKP